jgi:hypothetical protein
MNEFEDIIVDKDRNIRIVRERCKCGNCGGEVMNLLSGIQVTGHDVMSGFRITGQEIYTSLNKGKLDEETLKALEVNLCGKEITYPTPVNLNTIISDSHEEVKIEKNPGFFKKLFRVFFSGLKGKPVKENQ